MVYEFGPFLLDARKRLLFRDGQPVPLTPKVLDTLIVLLGKRGEIVDKDTLMTAVWPDAIVEESGIARNISVLRKKLGENPEDHQYIVTVPGQGYSFVADVRCTEGTQITENDIALPEIPEGPSAGDSEIEPTRDEGRSSRTSMAVGAAVSIGLLILIAVVMAAFTWTDAWRPDNGERPVALAVLPLENLSGDPSREYFSEGLTESLITELGKLPDLRVVARPSVSKYKGTPVPVMQATQELGVDTIVTGSVISDGTRVRVNLQIYRPFSRFTEWSHSYEEDIVRLVHLHRTITRDVAAALGRQAPAEPEKERPPQDPVAQEHFLKGKYHLSQMWNVVRTEEISAIASRAISELEQAIEADPQNAEAYSALAWAYSFLAPAGNAEHFRKAKDYAEKALSINEADPMAHAVIGHAAWRHDYGWPEGERRFKRAMELNPNFETVHHAYALLLSSIGRFDEAIHHIDRAEALNPLYMETRINSGFIWVRARRYEEAEQIFRRILEIKPDHHRARSGLAFSLACMGRYDEAIETIKPIAGRGDHPLQAMTYPWILARMGRSAEAREILKKFLKRPDWSDGRDAVAAAKVYAALGENGKAMDMLERAYAARSYYLVFVGVSPEFEPLAADERYLDLLRRLGIPDQAGVPSGDEQIQLNLSPTQ